MNTASHNLHKSILEYILYEINSKIYSPDCQESLEVAKQCLETAWNMEQGTASKNLLSIFEANYRPDTEVKQNLVHVEIDEDDKMSAERLKTQGNICMGENLFSDAVSCYSKAIELHPRNAVYYCNRAAAYSKLNKNDSAIEDCKQALQIDPKYGKAYSRMGLAYSAMNNFTEAINCYKRAIEIEPDNVNYKQNLQAAEERRCSGGPSAPGGAPSSGAGIPNLQSALQNFDISMILNNPAMMNMAQQMMSQPQMRNMMTQMMQSMIPQTNAGTATSPEAPDAPAPGDAGVGDSTTNINDFLYFGHQMAQQMQSANPDLVDSLRQRFNESGAAPGQNPQPAPSTPGSSETRPNENSSSRENH